MAEQKLRDLIAAISAGTVVGPASATDNDIAVFDGTTGKLIKDGGSTIAGVLSTALAAAIAVDPTPGGAPVNVTKAAAGAGAAATYSRSDHKHDITTAAAGTVTFGAAAEGSATSLARSDHTHALTAPGAPADVTKAAASAGASANVARQDHKHDVSTAAAVSITSATTNGEGSASSLARSDHTHLLSGTLDNNARVTVRKNTGADVGTRRRINLIEGSNITLTIADDAGSEEVDITIAAAAGGAGTFLQGTADFGTAWPRPETVTLNIPDAGVGAASIILLSVMPAAGRDADELELSPLGVTVGAISAGVGFDVLLSSLDGDAEGQFVVNATRN